MSFKDFVHKSNLRHRATSNIKKKQIRSSLSLNGVGIISRDSPFKLDIGIVNLHPTKGTHWIAYINDTLFNSFDCFPPQELFKFIIKRKRHCLLSEYKKQGLTSKRDSNCAAYCLYIIHVIKALGIDFKSAVLNLYYQIFSWIKMTKRKITVASSLKYITQIDQAQTISRERYIKPNTKDTNSVPGKQNKKLSKNIKKKLLQKHKQRVLKIRNDE